MLSQSQQKQTRPLIKNSAELCKIGCSNSERMKCSKSILKDVVQCNFTKSLYLLLTIHFTRLKIFKFIFKHAFL